MLAHWIDDLSIEEDAMISKLEHVLALSNAKLQKLACTSFTAANTVLRLHMRRICKKKKWEKQVENAFG